MTTEPLRRNEVIEREVDHLTRRLENWNRRALVATDEGERLARAVYEFLNDPDGVGTDALRAARDRFMAAHAGNFVRP
jgi:hypothetical protein